MSATDQLLPRAPGLQRGRRTVRADKRRRSRKPSGIIGTVRSVWTSLSPYARKHRRRFASGSLFAVLLVAIRVAMPWPLKTLIQPWLDGEAPGAILAPLDWHPAVVVGTIYALLVTALGFSDYKLRLHFARFAIGVVRDIRAAVLRGIRHMRHHDPGRTAADLVTRLIGDTARLKAGLKGFLVHVATNGLLFLGISGVMLWMEWTIGLIFLAASFLAVLATTAGAIRIYRLAIKYRRKESKIADSIADRLDLDHEDDEIEMGGASLGANRSSSRHEASITRVQGLTTWAAHMILAVAVPAALWQGYHAVLNHTMSAADLFVVMLYALMILGPMVRLTRQGARCGKILANADRLRDLLQATAPADGKPTLAPQPLRQGISLVDAKVRSKSANGKYRRIGPITLRIQAGHKIAVIGKAGSGKSTFLALLAGRLPHKGCLQWDETDFGAVGSGGFDKEVAYVPQSPSWVSMDVGEIVGPDGIGSPASPVAALFKYGGVGRLQVRLLNQGDGKIHAGEVSHCERKALSLIRYRASAHSLKLIDDPVSEISPNRTARKYLAALLGAQTGEQTVVVALDRPVALKLFDRVIVLKKGRVVFDGTPRDWEHARSVAASPADTRPEGSGMAGP